MFVVFGRSIRKMKMGGVSYCYKAKFSTLFLTKAELVQLFIFDDLKKTFSKKYPIFVVHFTFFFSGLATPAKDSRRIQKKSGA